jgi:tripartite-type tricarboxylate transporter receptor subunit TctC
MDFSFRNTLALVALLASAATSMAQTYPSKTITWVVPFSAGGPTDAMARDIADKVAKPLGQAIVIDNQAGAGGTIGSGKTARAAADGYTFLVGHLGYMSAAPALYKKLTYDPVKDFEPVFRFPDTPLVLLVPKNSPYKTAADLIAFAKKNSGKLNFGNAGVGSTSHLIAALFASKAGIQVTQVPYKGAGPAMNDLIAGQVDAMFDQTNTALPQIAGGRILPLALTSSQRMAQFPGVATLGESALPGFEAATWYGLYAPKGTPKDVIKKVHEAYLKALGDKAWTAKMASLGIQLLPDAQYAPDAFGKHTLNEVDKWRKVASEANITVD